LLGWQRVSGRRGLPWQGSKDPYRVWLSEIMLQQTQVSTVLDYYPRFLRRFADVQALAAAPLDEVLALWSGLGYYSRARNLHRCAQQVVAEHGGRFPASAEALERLPGIGRSTAAAIAAFCFGQRVAILDGNVKRVLSRVLGFGGDLASSANERALWAHANELLPPDAADMPAYTQGLMDLGATLCSVREPACGECPMASHCHARLHDAVSRLPLKTRRTKRHVKHELMLLLFDGLGRVWLAQRPSPGVWAGLWAPPLLDDASALGPLLGGVKPISQDALPPFKHVLTHRDWHFSPQRVRLPARLARARQQALEQRLSALPGAGPGRWWPLPEAQQAGLPAPVRKLLRALAEA
jgi:A/G-specific adenine glycosylase